jgi:ferredoxin
MASQSMSAERKKNLKALAKKMSAQQRDPLPVNKELIDCFDVFITPEENAYLLKLGKDPYTYEELAALSDLPEESFQSFYDTMRGKGLLWPSFEEGDKDRHSLAGIMVGWFETVLSDGKGTPEQKEFAHRLEKYFQSLKKMNFFPLRSYVNYLTRKQPKAPRTIAAPTKSREEAETVRVEVNAPLDKAEVGIYPPHSVNELIDKYGDQNEIAVMHCFCREWKKFVDEPCRFHVPGESCVVIGDFSTHTVEIGIGRYISKEDALTLVQELQKKGTVHQIFYPKDDIDKTELAICNCCWDCCGVLGSYSRGILPLRLKAFYKAEISHGELCTGCGTCVKHCPTWTILVVDKKSQIDTEKCIGCGQCQLQCPEGVISLVPEERDVILPLRKKSEARIRY